MQGPNEKNSQQFSPIYSQEIKASTPGSPTGAEGLTYAIAKEIFQKQRQRTGNELPLSNLFENRRDSDHVVGNILAAFIGEADKESKKAMLKSMDIDQARTATEFMRRNEMQELLKEIVHPEATHEEIEQGLDAIFSPLKESRLYTQLLEPEAKQEGQGITAAAAKKILEQLSIPPQIARIFKNHRKNPSFLLTPNEIQTITEAIKVKNPTTLKKLLTQMTQEQQGAAAKLLSYNFMETTFKEQGMTGEAINALLEKLHPTEKSSSFKPAWSDYKNKKTTWRSILDFFTSGWYSRYQLNRLESKIRSGDLDSAHQILEKNGLHGINVIKYSSINYQTLSEEGKSHALLFLILHAESRSQACILKDLYNFYLHSEEWKGVFKEVLDGFLILTKDTFSTGVDDLPNHPALPALNKIVGDLRANRKDNSQLLEILERHGIDHSKLPMLSKIYQDA